MKPSGLLAAVALAAISGGYPRIAIEHKHPREPHFGTPKGDPSRIRRPRKSRWWHQPPGYYAQTVPLKHLHSAAKFRAMLDVHHAEILATL